MTSQDSRQAHTLLADYFPDQFPCPAPHRHGHPRGRDGHGLGLGAHPADPALTTNLAYFGQWSFANRVIADTPLGWWRALIPAAGGLIIGLMARYGSEKIRGHGMPEAIEAILIGGSASAEGRRAQAALVGDRDRHRRAVRRRGADHHDRRRDRLAVRAAAST